MCWCGETGYVRKPGSKSSSAFVFSQAKACARQTLSLRTSLAEHTLQGVDADASSRSRSSTFTIAHVSLRIVAQLSTAARPPLPTATTP